MLAVIETGGKQYLVKSGEELKIEKLPQSEGDEVVFDKVLLMSDDKGENLQIGTPYVEGASVKASLEKQGRSKKVRVEKFKRKIRYHKKQGHRQHFSKVKIS